MKVISGNLKGRKLTVPRGHKVRPTGARVKEALFSILAEGVIGADVLDLFSGTGNIGVEALSRGANSSLFIENDPKTLLILEKNLRELSLINRSKVIKLDVPRGLKLLHKGGAKFDIIFIDPPYIYPKIWDIFSAVSKYDILKEGGIVVWEHDSKKIPKLQYGTLKMIETKKYGDTAITFFTKE